MNVRAIKSRRGAWQAVGCAAASLCVTITVHHAVRRAHRGNLITSRIWHFEEILGLSRSGQASLQMTPADLGASSDLRTFCEGLREEIRPILRNGCDKYTINYVPRDVLVGGWPFVSQTLRYRVDVYIDCEPREYHALIIQSNGRRAAACLSAFMANWVVFFLSCVPVVHLSTRSL